MKKSKRSRQVEEVNAASDKQEKPKKKVVDDRRLKRISARIEKGEDGFYDMTDYVEETERLCTLQEAVAGEMV